MPAPIRFQPPPLVLSSEIRWMLLRAFGPLDAPFPGTVEPTAALALARRFEMSARIATRQGRERLAAELGGSSGEATAAAFVHDRRSAAAVGLRLMGEAGRVAAVAAALGIPLAFLKFAALEAAGMLAAGSRGACDIDLLAPGSQARELWSALVAAGFRGSGLPEAEHQLPALAWPEGGAVEIHLTLSGVRLGGAEDRSAGYETLAAAGMLRPLPAFPGRCAAPPPEVLAAHVLVHGIGQHGFWPASYPLFKMVADLIDLGELDALTDRALGWVARDVSPAEAAAVRRLVARLAAGEDPVSWPSAATGEETLLRHILAGRLDPGYERALRLGLFRPQPSDRPRPLQLARTVLGAVFLSRAQIDAIYGPPRTPLGYLGRRIARPFDLGWRLGRYAWARLSGS
jgi:hypothetical protein